MALALETRFLTLAMNSARPQEAPEPDCVPVVHIAVEARVDPPVPDIAVKIAPAISQVAKPAQASMFARILAAKALKPVPK